MEKQGGLFKSAFEILAGRSIALARASVSKSEPRPLSESQNNQTSIQ